jgi:hypothetical protein
MKIGLTAALYVGGTEATNVRDLTLNIEVSTAEASRRGSTVRQFVGTLKGYSIEFDYLAIAGDTMLTTLTNAFNNGTSLSVAAEDSGASYGSGIGLRGLFIVTGFNRNEPLEEGITYSVVMVPAYSATDPYFS